MAVIDYAALTAPVSDAEPCGPDLDLTGDPDFMNFMAKAEGLLPSSYFSSRDGKPFDRGSIDFAAEFAAAKPFLEQTRDLRLLTTLAKFHVLDRDLVGFEACIRTIGSLLNERWDDVHPRSEDGDLTIRMAALETLDDSPTVVLPLQFIPLINSRRFGIITYRSYMIAVGEAKPLDEEEPIDVATIDKSLMEAELEPLVETLRQFDSLQAGLNNIHAIWIDHAGFEQAVNLQKAPQLVGKIVALLNGVVTKRDPTLARAMSESAPTEGATSATQSAIPAGSVTSPADAADALAAVAQYFSRSEPSNPALLLVRQAEELIGKSFVEVMRILVPAHVEQAAIAIGAEQAFQLPMEKLSALLPAYGGNGSAADGSTADGSEVAQEPPPRRLQANTRQEAFSLLEQAGAYYRAAEPSSPVAVIIERARRIAERDFLSLLQDFLPDLMKANAAGE